MPSTTASWTARRWTSLAQQRLELRPSRRYFRRAVQEFQDFNLPTLALEIHLKVYRELREREILDLVVKGEPDVAWRSESPIRTLDFLQDKTRVNYSNTSCLLTRDPRCRRRWIPPWKRVRPSLLSLYAKYFHGDLILNSCDGYAVVYLKTLANGQDRKDTTFSNQSAGVSERA